MITRAHLIDILRDHGRRRNIRDMRTHCLCGWVSGAPNGAAQHLQHVADTILEAVRLVEQRRGPKRGGTGSGRESGTTPGGPAPTAV